MACNGEPMNLACDGGEESRVAVYSAHFASAAGSHMYCPLPDRGLGIHSDTKNTIETYKGYGGAWHPLTKRVRKILS